MKKVTRYEDKAGVLHESAEDAAVGDAWSDMDSLVKGHVTANPGAAAALISDFLRANGRCENKNLGSFHPRDHPAGNAQPFSLTL